MSKHDFSAEEFEIRQRRVRKAMADQQLEVLIVIAPANIQYLIGTRTKSYQEFQCLLFPIDKSKPLTVLTRLAEVFEYQDLSLANEVHGWGGREPQDPVEVLKGILTNHDYLRSRVGLEVPAFYLSVHDHTNLRAVLRDADVVEVTSMIEDMKLIKSPKELEYIRRAALIANNAMQVATDHIHEGAIECEVAGAVYQSLLAQGGDSPASPLNLVSGERSGFAHGAPSERRIAKGDSVNIEFGAAYRRYCTTIGRQFCIGEPSARLKELFAVVKDACDVCIELMTPGRAAIEPHNAAKKVIADAGYDANRWHTTGYGIAPGYPPSWGESIHMFGDSEYVLEAGMMLSVEPPIYIAEERMGVRLIDNVLITESGPELLTTFKRNLIEC